MRGVQTNCPACGGPVRFKLSSALVTVCEYCRTVVARTDRAIEDLGKVAAIVETASPLHVGLKGTFKGKRFAIMGRAQHQHAAGGLWDEWYVAFPNGRWGWLAEAQGRFYLTFEKELPETVRLPAMEALRPGGRVKIGDQELTVAEVGEATSAGAEGEMPFVLHPGASHRYADLYGTEKRFVTLDYDTERPAVYIGHEVTLDDLGISPDAKAPERELKRVGALQVNCPQCGGALALHAPGQSLRVVCPHCSAMLDAAQGKLQYLQTLDFGRTESVIEIGATGTLNGIEFTCVGFVRRSVTYDSTDYYWTEYLLYEPRTGFRWLINSEGHWSYGEPVSPGDVTEGARDAQVAGETFKLYQQATATVRYVLGEFYWKVELGETSYARDFIAPPRMLTIEHSTSLNRARTQRKKKRPAVPVDPDSPVYELESDVETADEPAVTAEVNCTLSTYVPVEEVEKAFGLVALDRGFGVAPNQPSPVDGQVFRWWAGFLAAIAAFYLLGKVIGPGSDGWLGFWAAAFVSVIPVIALIYRHSVETSRWSNSDYSPYSSE